MTISARAPAQSASDQAAAEALFRQGRELVAAGQYAAACPKFAESQRLDPAPGTLLNLANCYEKNGQIASAWVTYKEAATSARQADQVERARMARDKAAELEVTLPLLTIQVSPAADRPDLQVRRDGALVGRAEWATPIPVDPGNHVVEASAPGARTWRGSAALPGAGSKALIDVPPLEPVAASAPGDEPSPVPLGVRQSAGDQGAGVGASSSRRAAAGALDPDAAGPRATGSAQRAAGWAVGAVGLAGIAAGAVLGVLAIDDKNALANHCIEAVCDVQGHAFSQDGRRLATASTVAFVAGGALLAGGIALVWSAPREGRGGIHRISLGATPGPAVSAAVGGTW